MTIDLMDMFQRHGYDDAFLFGHALEGNLHLVFSQVGGRAVRAGAGWGRRCAAVAGRGLARGTHTTLEREGWASCCECLCLIAAPPCALLRPPSLCPQGFRSPEEVQRFHAMFDELCYIVATKHSGSLKGEHGTGRNVAPYVEMEWGEWGLSVCVRRKTRP